MGTINDSLVRMLEGREVRVKFSHGQWRARLLGRDGDHVFGTGANVESAIMDVLALERGK